MRALATAPFLLRHAITLPLLCLQVLLLITPTFALHESDVGVVDWHKHLIGSPQVSAHVTAPSFLVYGEESERTSENKKTLIVTATVNNVLGVLDSEDGSILWRYVFEPEDRITGYYKSSKSIATLSGPGGATLRLFNALSGTLLLEKRLHPPSLGTLAEPAHLGKHVIFANGDGEREGEILYVLTNGCTVSSLNATSGELLWTWTAEDRGSLTINSHLHVTPTALYVTGLAKSLATFTIHLTTLSPTTGAVIHNAHVPSSITDPLAHWTLLHTSSSSSFKPTLLWIETTPTSSEAKQTSLRYLPLTPTLKDKPRPLQGTGFTSILPLSDALGGTAGHAVILGEDGRGYVLRAQASGEEGGKTGGVTVSLIGEFAVREEGGFYAVDVGANGGDGDVNVARIGWVHDIEKASVDVFTSLGAQAAAKGNANATRWGNFTFPFDTRTHGIINHVTLDSSSSEHQVVVTTSTGSIQLWTSSSSEDPKPKWIREEALASVILAEFVEIPPASEDGKRFSGAGLGGEGEGFMKRLGRQIVDAQDLPRYLVNFVKRFITGSYETPSSSPIPVASSESDSASATKAPLARDTFGFRQLIILTTLHGKIYALDSLTGTVVWSRVLGMGWVGRAGQGGRVLPVRVFVVKSVGEVGGWGYDGESKGVGDGAKKEGPEVVIVAQRRADNSLIDTVIFHIDALTGADRGHNARALAAMAEDGSMSEQPGDLLEGEDVIQGAVVEAYMIPLELDLDGKKVQRKVVLMLDEFLQVYLYPSTPLTEAAFSSLISKSPSNSRSSSLSLSFPLRTSVETRHRITGHTIAPPPEHERHHKPVAHPTWSLTFPLGEEVQTLVSQTHSGSVGVASLGRVLGNRTTLYKYLDPRLFVVQTVVKQRKANGQENGNAAKGMCGIYVVDGVKGTVVYHAEVAATTGLGQGGLSVPRCEVKTTLVENWLVYHYYEPEVAGGSVGGAKGYRMVSVEFYEGAKGTVDQKVESSDLSPYSNDTLNYAVYEQSYVFPSAITAMATTSTKFGITSKDLIVAMKSRKVHYIPKRLLDPRRPNRKPTAEEQQEEFLVQYEPLLPEDPRRTLSHNYDVANVQKILTSPALLESTSLVFAYGLDMFMTRVAPSNTFDILSENFNKLQLVLTVLALALGIVVSRPMMRRKVLREKWYQS